MKKLSELSIFDLYKLLEIIEKMRNKYDKQFASYGLTVLQDENCLNTFQREILIKRREFQVKYEEIEDIIEEKIFKEYV